MDIDLLIDAVNNKIKIRGNIQSNTEISFSDQSIERQGHDFN